MRTSYRLLALGAVALVAACQDSAPVGPDAGNSEGITFTSAETGSVIAGRYIVVFKEGTTDAPGLARRLTQAHGGKVRRTYEHAIKGFSAELPEAAAAALRRNPNVASVEQDQVVRKHATTQTGATWGIDRIDQLDLPLSGTYTYTPDGTGVTAYILDTGIRFAHVEFGGRAVSGFDAIDGGTADDCDGHGTHVAGTVGGTTFGVAKKVQLVAVRVLDCAGSGTWEGVIEGIDWVTANAQKPAVANMSLGGGAISAVDQAVANSIASGVFYSLSAGNGNQGGKPIDACQQSPARTPAAMTVGATTSSDTESSFSNYGTCVDILAPGSAIVSSYYTSNTATASASGTSMAAPHVTGAAALYLDANNGSTPAQVTNALKAAATPNTISLHRSSAGGGTPNLMLYTGFMNGGTEPPPAETAPANLTLAKATKGKQSSVNLSWTGGSAASVTVRRNTVAVATTANDGSYSDNLGRSPSGTYTYQVCNSPGTLCSDTASVTY